MTTNPLTPPEASACRNGFAQSGSTQNGSVWSKSQAGQSSEIERSPQAELDQLFGRIKEIQMEKVGKSGGSKSLPNSGNRRGLEIESGDPLVLWWAKSFKSESPADVERQESYRRSRWGQGPEPKKIPAAPYLEMHKEGKLMKPLLFSLILALCASLNMVASAQDAVSAIAPERATSQVKIASPVSEERVEMTRAFAGQHKQVLNYSKLNELLRANEGEAKTEGANLKYPKAS